MATVVDTLLVCLTMVTVGQCLGEFADLTERVSRMEALMHKLENDNQRLMLDNEKLLGGLSQLKTENKKLLDDLTKVRSDNERLKVKTRNMEAETRRRNTAFDLKILALEAACYVSLPKLANDQYDDTQTDHVTVPRDMVARSDDTSPLEAVVASLSQQVTAVSGEVQVLKSVDQQLGQAIQQAATSTYTRWGHSACPPGNNLVYTGVVGGSSYDKSGAATNSLCLTLSPVASDHAVTAYNAVLYGAEYETWKAGVVSEAHVDKDPVCAVCRSPRPNTIMIPGTDVCTSDWTREYSGYLMAGYGDHMAGTEFICMDTAMMSRQGGNENLNGKLFYFTVTHCGSLPCEPYVNNTIVTCAVCSQ